MTILLIFTSVKIIEKRSRAPAARVYFILLNWPISQRGQAQHLAFKKMMMGGWGI